MKALLPIETEVSDAFDQNASAITVALAQRVTNSLRQATSPRPRSLQGKEKPKRVSRLVSRLLIRVLKFVEVHISLAMCIPYVSAAQTEQALLKGVDSAQYLHYRSTTGMFIPRPRKRIALNDQEFFRRALQFRVFGCGERCGTLEAWRPPWHSRFWRATVRILSLWVLGPACYMTLPSECVALRPVRFERLIHLVVVVVTVGMWKSA